MNPEPTLSILVADELGSAGVERLKRAEGFSVEVRTGLSKEALVEIIGSYDGLIVRSATQVDAEVIEASTPRLRVIGRAGVGVDNIDLEAATRRGILVTNTPDSNTVSTAEHAMALILAVSRNIVPAHEALSRGEWKRSAFAGRQLAGKVLGLVGLGRVGREVAHRAHALGMEVIASDPFIAESLARETNVTLVELPDLLHRADYISLHTQLSADTEGMINDDTIAQMKDGVVLINAARGKLVDEEALAAGLDSGKVRAAALDVYREEPPRPNHPLITHPRVVHTPHLGASTEEAQRNAALAVADQMIDALRGDDFRNAVNLPFVPGPEFAETHAYLHLAEKMGQIQFAMAPRRIRALEIEVRSEMPDYILKVVAAGMLKGVLSGFMYDGVNWVNAPALAEDHDIQLSQTFGIGQLDYPNLVSCRARWDGGNRVISGVVFAHEHPRIVQVSSYHLDARPEGIVLLMLNDDVPGVIGDVGTLLGEHGVNIAEWRLGRDDQKKQALSFINLDSEPEEDVMAALRKMPAVLKAELVTL